MAFGGMQGHRRNARNEHHSPVNGRDRSMGGVLGNQSKIGIGTGRDDQETGGENRSPSRSSRTFAAVNQWLRPCLQNVGMLNGNDERLDRLEKMLDELEGRCSTCAPVRPEQPRDH